jgi:hypothetical protein
LPNPGDNPGRSARFSRGAFEPQITLGLMRQVFHIAAFWIAVVVTIRLAVCFPHSLLARIYFSQFGPVPMRGEAKSDYLLRCAWFGCSWFMQAAFLFVAGWVALGWDASLADSLYFLVLWAVVIPVLGGVALLASLWALVRLLRVRWVDGAGSTQSSQA